MTSPTTSQIESLHKRILDGDDAAKDDLNRAVWKHNDWFFYDQHGTDVWVDIDFVPVDGVKGVRDAFTTDATSALSLKWPESPTTYSRIVWPGGSVTVVWWYGLKNLWRQEVEFTTPSLPTNLLLANLWAWADHNQRNGDTK